MNLNIHNDLALRIIKLGGMDPKEMIEYMRAHGTDPTFRVMAITGAYTCELIRAAEESRADLDLNYDTVSNIPLAVFALSRKQQAAGYDNERNRIVTCRTLAAYIDLLAINCHDLTMSVNAYANKKNEVRPDMWSDKYVIKLNNKRDSDMLKYVAEGVDNAFEVENGFMIDVEPLINAYLKLTGKNLSDYGLANMIVDLTVQSLRF